MKVGIPKEALVGERRAAAAPDTVSKLVKMGFEVTVERGLGLEARFGDEAYVKAGATLTDRAGAWSADIVLKIHPPRELEDVSELDLLAEGATLICMVYPGQNLGIVEAVAAKKGSLIALEQIPRTTVAQKMDVLSSMANIAGYRAIVEATNVFGSFMGGQITAAGSTKPAKVLIIGAGVAGLAALGAAKALGAEVRAFDTRAAARTDVESLGGRFLEVDFKEDGEGQGGYAKLMSPAFIAAEMALFRKQAAEVDIIVTTALVPGRKAPLLLPEDVVSALRPGSVVVDLAASQGGNCALTVPGQVVERAGVTYIGYTDLTSRLPGHASQFFGSNLAHLLKHMGGGQGFKFNLDDENVRPAVLVHAGQPLPKVAPPVVAAPKPPSESAATNPHKGELPKPGERGPLGGAVALIAGLVSLLGVAFFAPADFLQHLTVFVLACFVGWQVIWNVSPALHTPLMSVTNAISGIIVVGGMLQLGADWTSPSALLGALAVLLASINIAGGFAVTQRMLRMFHRGGGSDA